MQLINKNLKKQVIKLKVETLDDLWYLSQLVSVGDLVSGRTLRKIKRGLEEDRAVKVIKKPVFLSIKVEKLEFHESTGALRITGTVSEGPEDVPKGSYHTFNVEENTILTINKNEWLSYHLERLNQAVADKAPPILIVALDREDVVFAKLKKNGYQILSFFQGQVEKKQMEGQAKDQFYSMVEDQIAEYNTRYKIENIIVASPAFFKEDFMKQLRNSEIKPKIVLATCSSVTRNAVDEIIKRPEVKAVLHKERLARESDLVDRVLEEIAVNGAVAYGTKHVEQAVAAGAVKIILITDGLITKSQSDNCYAELNAVLASAEKMKGEVHLISSSHDKGKQLDSLGGIAAILRYKIA